MRYIKFRFKIAEKKQYNIVNGLKENSFKKNFKQRLNIKIIIDNLLNIPSHKQIRWMCSSLRFSHSNHFWHLSRNNYVIHRIWARLWWYDWKVDFFVSCQHIARRSRWIHHYVLILTFSIENALNYSIILMEFVWFDLIWLNQLNFHLYKDTIWDLF